ncbi:diguanylate cyclase [Alginatibacterium sediminis]|uniref:diguanylate cyclase n=1 Tax=Alginatibacterium sediminis TaxID=2164068 RepID=A0A420E6G5_9ALTE|nr:GGDEF domain-containing protein [Alginatibacterium sediminis]RKF13270.1 diguanylate cyclase [Alginatibacterium sediminis]
MPRSRLKYARVIALSVFIASVLPSIGLSWLLINKHTQNVEQATEDELTRIAQSVRVELVHRYNNLLSNIELISNDRTLNQAIEDFLYAGNAYSILERFSNLSSSRQSVYLVSKDFEVVEQYQGYIDAFEQSPIVRKIKREIAQQPLDHDRQLVMVIEDQELFNSPDGERPISMGFAIVSPIYNMALHHDLRTEANGYLISINSFQAAIESQLGTLGKSDILTIDYNGVWLASSRNPDTPKGEHELSVVESFVVSAPSMNSDLAFNLHISRDFGARGNRINYLETLSFSFAGIIALSVIISLIIGRMVSQPFRRMSEIINQFKDGNYRLDQEREFRFDELHRMQILIQSMGGRIEQQLFLMNKKNKELEQVSGLKDQYLEEVKQFNVQLEARVVEQTKAMSLTLNHAQHHRELLHTLLNLSYDLQQCKNSDEVNEICVSGLCRILVSVPVAIMIRRIGEQNDSFLSSGISLEEQQLIRDQLEVFFNRKHSQTAEIFTVASFNYSLFPLAGVSEFYHGCILIRSDELNLEVKDSMSLFARQVGSIVESIELNSELQLVARTDALTGLANRKAFNEAMERQTGLYKRYPKDHFGLFIVDANGLKQVNDQYGHDQGDALICNIGEILRSQVRGVDKVYRLAGDEFAILVKKGELVSCKALELRLQQVSLEHFQVMTPNDGETVKRPVSFSVGYASSETMPIEDMFKAADKAMYEHKSAYYQHQKS